MNKPGSALTGPGAKPPEEVNVGVQAPSVIGMAVGMAAHSRVVADPHYTLESTIEAFRQIASLDICRPGVSSEVCQPWRSTRKPFISGGVAPTKLVSAKHVWQQGQARCTNKC